MTVTEFDEMINLLKQATKNEKLIWETEGNIISFKTMVNGCKVVVSVYYDNVSMSNKASIEMFNISGNSFKKNVYGQSAKPEIYFKIKELYDLIKDHYYKITESEHLILNGLRELSFDNKELKEG